MTSQNTPSGNDDDLRKDVTGPFEEDISEEIPVEESPPAFISWPPPGLEQIQGALLPAAGFLALGVGFLILPLLISIGSYQSFTSLGPFSTTWEILAISTGLGLLSLFEAFRRFFRILRSGNLAVRMGHGWLTVAHVAADSTRDTGFLIQGARAYTNVDVAVRSDLLLLHILGRILLLTALFWALIGFVLSIFLAARGILGPSGLWYVTLGPTFVLLSCALYIRIREGLMRRSVTRGHEEELREEVGSQVQTWTTQLDAHRGSGILGRGPSSRILHVRVILTTLLVVGLILLIPIVTFTFVGAFVQTTLGDMIPRFQGVEDKAMIAEVYREYILEKDPSITPLEAGQALHSLSYVGKDLDLKTYELPPERVYEQPWLFGRNRVKGTPSYMQIYEPGGPDLTEEGWSILRQEASNRAHDEFALLGRAEAIDLGGARWSTPLPDSISFFDIAVLIPRFQNVSDGAKAHGAVAGYLFQRGRVTEAEEMIREIISTGFLLIDEEPTLIGNLIGIVVAGIGGSFLEDLYRHSGREMEANEMQSRYQEALNMRSGRILTPIRKGRLDLESALEIVAEVISDEDALRGLRWEFLLAFNTIAPCVNLHKAVFGPGDDYDLWLRRVHDSLVRYPSEEELFERAQYGWLMIPGEDEEDAGVADFLLGITFGKGKTRNSLISLIRATREY